MADLRINDVSPQLKTQVKVAAAKANQTMREFVIASLTAILRAAK